MTPTTHWSGEALPLGQSIDRVLYDLRRDDAGERLLLDSACLADITEDSDGGLAFDALVMPYAQMAHKMELLNGVMQRSGQGVKPVSFQVSEPFKQSGTANVATVFELSDGQTVSVYFHNPDVTPGKMAGTDEVISWKWLLNKKDITLVVAPERGDDLNVREVARRVMKLAEKNSAAFQRANGKRAETLQRIEGIQAEVAGLEKELKTALSDLEGAKFEKEERAGKADVPVAEVAPSPPMKEYDVQSPNEVASSGGSGGKPPLQLSNEELDRRGIRVKNYAENVLAGTSKANRIDVGVLCESAADRISLLTKLPAHSSMEVVVADAIIHSTKRHADLIGEDWAKLPSLTNQFDDVYLGKKDKNPYLTRIVIKKTFESGDGYGAVLAFAEGKGKKRLNLVTFLRGAEKVLRLGGKRIRALTPPVSRIPRNLRLATPVACQSPQAEV